MPIRGGGARVSAWSACRTANGSAVSELRCRSAAAASWSGPAEGPTEYKVAARRFAPNGELPSDYRSTFLQGELDRETPIQALTIGVLTSTVEQLIASVQQMQSQTLELTAETSLQGEIPQGPAG